MRRPTLLRRATLLLTGLSALSACGSDEATTPPPSERETLEIYSWWTNPGEKDALTALLGVFQSKYPKIAVENATVADVVAAQQKLRERMIAGTPPDSFQTLSGWDLLQWVVYNGADDADTKLEPLDELATKNGWQTVFPKSLRDMVTFNGKMYAVPVAVHRTNVLFYSKKVFADNGLSPPTNLSELYRVGDTLKARGIIPIAIGNSNGLALASLVWDSVFVDTAGVDFRNSYFTRKEDPRDQRVVAALTETVKLLDYVNPGLNDVSWGDAAEMVLDGRAAMVYVGDWAKGYMLKTGWKPDVELGEIPMLSAGAAFTYVCDSFDLTRGAPRKEDALYFLETIGSAEAQDAFNPIKGSTPPRLDANPSHYDALARATLDHFHTKPLTGSFIMTAKPDFLAPVSEALKQFAADRNVETVVNVIANRYDQL